MPVYEYDCNDCREHAEALQKYDDPPPVCAKCGGTMRKVFRTPPALSIMLKSEGGTSVGDRARAIERRRGLKPGSLVPVPVNVNEENRGLDESKHEAITAAKKAGYSEGEYNAAMAMVKTKGINPLYGKLPTKE